MSTFITINTGGDALLDRNQQEALANRLAQLKRENAENVEAEGQQKRDERLAAEGRNPDGSLKAGAYPKAERYTPDPAANRRQQGNLGHLWEFELPVVESGNSAGYVVTGYPNHLSNAPSTKVTSSKQEYFARGADGSASVPFSTLTVTPPALPSPNDTVIEIDPNFGVDANNRPTYLVTYWRTCEYSSSAEHYRARFALPAGSDVFMLIEATGTLWNQVVLRQTYAEARYSDDDSTSSFHGHIRQNEDPTASSESSGVEFKAWVCSTKKVRQLSLSGTTLSILEKLCPDPELETVDVVEDFILDRSYGTVEIHTGFTGITGWAFSGDPDEIYPTSTAETLYTPAVFRQINEYLISKGDSGFVSQAKLKEIRASVKRPLPNWDRGTLTLFDNFNAWGTPIAPSEPWKTIYTDIEPGIFQATEYARWPVAGQRPDMRAWGPQANELDLPTPQRFPSARLLLSPKRTPLPTEYAGDGEVFLTVYDWDDPRYCRQMCKAFGFSDADLRP